MIFVIGAKPILETYQSARVAESAATETLLTYLNMGGRDGPTLKKLTNTMTETHRRSMGIWSELQQLSVAINLL